MVFTCGFDRVKANSFTIFPEDFGIITCTMAKKGHFIFAHLLGSVYNAIEHIQHYPLPKTPHLETESDRAPLLHPQKDICHARRSVSHRKLKDIQLFFRKLNNMRKAQKQTVQMTAFHPRANSYYYLLWMKPLNAWLWRLCLCTY